MDRFVNIEILGHPLNWFIIVGIIVLLWFGLYALRTRVASATGSDAS